MFIQNFVVGSERRMCFEIECIMVLRGHARSLILAPMESAYICDFYIVINSNFGPYLAPFRDITGFPLISATPPLIHTNFWGVPLGLADVVAPRCEYPKLIRVIIFELIQPIRQRYINVTGEQTDGQTDGRLSVAIPRFCATCIAR